MSPRIGRSRAFSRPWSAWLCCVLPSCGRLKPQSHSVSDRLGKLVKRDRQPPGRGLLDRQLVVPSTNVLDEGMARDDHPGAADSLEASHRPQPGLEASVIGLDVVVGKSLSARHCCICRSLTPASSTRGPERHRRCPGLIALSTSDSRLDGKRVHVAIRRRTFGPDATVPSATAFRTGVPSSSAPTSCGVCTSTRGGRVAASAGRRLTWSLLTCGSAPTPGSS